MKKAVPPKFRPGLVGRAASCSPMQQGPVGRSAFRSPMQPGVTLVELIVVLSISAALAGTAALSYRAVERRALQSASEMLAADFRYAQRMSMIEGRRWYVLLEPKENRYYLRYVNSGADATVIKDVTFSGGVRLHKVTDKKLDYLPRGTISQGFSLWLTKGKYWQRITGLPSSGRVSVNPIIFSENGTIPPEVED